MKLLVLLTVVGFCTCQAVVNAQNNKITLSVSNGTLSDVFRQIEQLTDCMFVYKTSDIASFTDITIDCRQTEVSRILDECLSGTGLSYRFKDNLVIIQSAALQIEGRRITGKVTDTHRAPLPGVTVIIKGTSMGVVTDAEGKYSIELPDIKDIHLRFTFVGMKTHEVAYSGQKEIDVTLQEEAMQMDEVVVTGYQVIDRRKNTSAIQTVKVDDIMIPSATSIDQMLEGRITDMMLMTNSGEVGVAPKIRIRGTSTLVGNREPLWVVDGIIVQDPVPISPQELNDPDYINRIGNAIAGLNPQDIERLDILKDAAATALYGSKAANGVIVITTKKGRIGEPVISYNMTTTFRQRPRYTDRKIDLMNSKERIQFSRELFQNHYEYDDRANLVGYEGLLDDLYNGRINDTQFAEKVAKLETINTDWFDLLTEDTFSHQHTVSISGGTERVNYYSSIGFSRDNDVINENYNERYTASINVTTNLARWFSASFKLSGNVSERKYNQDEINPMTYAYNSSRAIPAYDEDGEYAYYEKHESESYLYWNYNILNELENSYNNQNSSGITLATNLQFNFTDWLNANAVISYGNSNAEIEGYWGEKTWHIAALRRSNYGENAPSYSNIPFGGELNRRLSRLNTYTARLQMNVNKYFGLEEQHNINASGGFELNSTRTNGNSSVHRGFYPDRGKIFVENIDAQKYPDYAAWAANNMPEITDDLTRMVSYYVTLSYSYQNYFTLNANARVDGSNKFGDTSNDKFLPIWSVSGNYNFSEHDFLKRDWIDNLTLKLSYGFQGNMLSNVSPNLLIKKNAFDPYFGEMTSSIHQIPNPNLKWEKTNSFNAGILFSLLERRIQFEGSYYYKHTKDAFMSKNIATMNGVESYIINRGDVENKGYSVDVTLNAVRSKDWNWTLATSFSKNFNKIKSDPGNENCEYFDFLNGTIVVKDKAVNTFYSYKFVGLSPVDGGPLFDDYEDHQQELDGLSKYETFKKVLTVSGRREPYMSGGLSTALRYKNLRMNAMFTYSLGAKTRLFRMFDSKKIAPERNLRREYLKRWQKPGDEKHTDIPAIISYNEEAYWRYNENYCQTTRLNIQPFATNAWSMYDYSDLRVVSANYLKCSSMSLTYEFGGKILPKLKISRLDLTLSGTNLFTICSRKLKGQTPTQGGFSEIQLSDRPTYSFSLNVSF